jgi:hypothetical protein
MLTGKCSRRTLCRGPTRWHASLHACRVDSHELRILPPVSVAELQVTFTPTAQDAGKHCCQRQTHIDWHAFSVQHRVHMQTSIIAGCQSRADPDWHGLVAPVLLRTRLFLSVPFLFLQVSVCTYTAAFTRHRAPGRQAASQIHRQPTSYQRHAHHA